MLTVNSKCLAYHYNLLYEAKILRVYSPEQKDTLDEDTLAEIPEALLNEDAFRVHYKGWKSSWDEWVGSSRVLPLNEENVKLQKQLKAAALEETKKAETGTKDNKRSSTAASGGENSTPSSTTRSNKRSRTAVELDVEKEDDWLKKAEISFTVPDTLKAILVDDWEYITKDHQLVRLPRSPTVVDILKKYKKDTTTKRANSAEADIFDEVLSGLKLYFDRALGNILLYRYERRQYLEIRKKYPDLAFSEIYGGEHLLRLFVSLPGLLAQTTMDQQSISTLKSHLEDLLKYLAKNSEEIFRASYEFASPEYDQITQKYENGII